MKLKPLITTLLIVLTFFDGICQKGISQNETFELSGEITNDYAGYLYLEYGNKIDSTLIENKTFSFTGKVDFPIESKLITKNGHANPFYLENSKMRVNLSVNNNITSINSLEGNKTAIILSDLQNYFQKIGSDSDFSTKLYKKLDTIITQNPRNQFSGTILSDVIMDPIFSYQQAFNLFNKLDLTTQKDYEIKSIKASLLKLKNIRIGTTIKNFELPNTKGEFINTKDLKKTVLLIEFWASWCGPCRQVNPELVKIYSDYREKGFEIYGVSLDLKKESWIKAIKDDNLYWTQTIAKGGFNNETIKPFGIQAIPANFLIDNNGKILDINIKPVELEKKLIKLFEK